jgi:hypothetical protein
MGPPDYHESQIIRLAAGAEKNTLSCDKVFFDL